MHHILLNVHICAIKQPQFPSPAWHGQIPRILAVLRFLFGMNELYPAFNLTSSKSYVSSSPCDVWILSAVGNCYQQCLFYACLLSASIGPKPKQLDTAQFKNSVLLFISSCLNASIRMGRGTIHFYSHCCVSSSISAKVLDNLLEYVVLVEKATAATAHHNELSAKIKAAEKRMAEIAVLRTHIINYAKTRDTYVAYRKAGYSKKFREEHEEEILLHQAAKNAFDDMGVKKLPKGKELQAEYARLLEEKKKTYAEYRRSREEMRELLAAKANVDRLLNMEAEHDGEKEKDHDQR